MADHLALDDSRCVFRSDPTVNKAFGLKSNPKQRNVKKRERGRLFSPRLRFGLRHILAYVSGYE